MPFFSLASNESQFSAATNFTIDTSDTAVSTTLSVASGAQVTLLNVQSNYIDITLDNLSSITFSMATSSRYFKITKLSGSSAYSVSPTCPTNSATIVGTGATVVLRLEVVSVNNCSASPLPANNEGGYVSYVDDEEYFPPEIVDAYITPVPINIEPIPVDVTTTPVAPATPIVSTPTLIRVQWACFRASKDSSSAVPGLILHSKVKSLKTLGNLSQNSKSQFLLMEKVSSSSFI